MPGIKEAAVIGKEDDRLGTRILAFLVLDEVTTINQVKTYSHQNLTNEKRPHDFYLRSNFPKNANGKIDKILLQKESVEA
jgi:acyl-coenzyme A synthetase/AMP-(fatty) acid ligase